jgi:hypothetical protein
MPPPTGQHFARIGETFQGELLLRDGRRVRSP